MVAFLFGGLLIVIFLAMLFVTVNEPVVNPTPRPNISEAAASPVNLQEARADANGDGSIDDYDYAVWAINYNNITKKGILDGDFNTDGVVDGLDYVVLLNSLHTKEI